jgi:hypothetical protein
MDRQEKYNLFNIQKQISIESIQNVKELSTAQLNINFLNKNMINKNPHIMFSNRRGLQLMDK